MLLLFGLATFAIPMTLGIMHPVPVYGQVLYREEPLSSFEVVSVKLMPNGPPPTPPLQGGSTVHIYFTTKMLIGYAYNLPDFSEDRITKGPGWTDATYDVQWKISDADFTAMQKMSPFEKQEQIQLRLQSMLKDRFNLKVHLEKREQTIFVLEVAKGGPRISAAKDQVPERFDITHSGMDYDLKATRTNMDQLVRLLGRQPEVGGRSIVTKTGLSGDFDVTLHWTRTGLSIPDAASSPSEENALPYFLAIQEQLGLRLSSAKGQVDYIVVDHIERPSTN